MIGPILVTRPREQAMSFVRDLAPLNHAVLVDPLSEIVPLNHDFSQVPVPRTIIVTSANVFLQPLPDSWRSVPVYAVGPQSEEAARMHGFTNITTGEGRATDLVALLDKAADPVYYLRGAVVKFDIASVLLAYANRRVVEYVMYENRPTKGFSPDVIAAFKNRNIGVVCTFSPSGADNLIGAITKAKLAEYCDSIYCLCLDQTMIQSCKAVGWKAVLTAPRPDRSGMIEALSGLLSDQ